MCPMMLSMIRFLIALLLFLSVQFVVILPVQAAFCRNLNNHEICILEIKRSAKNYWEYRASVKEDGVKRPIEVYNCRDRTHTRNDGTTIPFEPNSAGALICRFFRETTNG